MEKVLLSSHITIIRYIAQISILYRVALLALIFVDSRIWIMGGHNWNYLLIWSIVKENAIMVYSIFALNRKKKQCMD